MTRSDAGEPVDSGHYKIMLKCHYLSAFTQILFTPERLLATREVIEDRSLHLGNRFELAKCRKRHVSKNFFNFFETFRNFFFHER
jgi:hypothetical protein